MDILDIDEVLKDDSFIFLADKAHDDVSNILQQWKTNNGPMQQQQQNDQAYKLNSKTFTRPKRRSAQNLENQFSIITHQNHNLTQQQQQQQQNSSPMLNLEIGGLVTNLHKSFLQDTSPPSSICSSMEVSMDRMNNSLVTSADFTNLQFLQSTQSLDFNCDDLLNCGFNMMLDKTTTGDVGGGGGGYTLSDMIRDRKALESLTMSADGTLIKDSQIAQIDDISLTLSKTASGCSTMDNSTDSVGGCGTVDCNNRTMELMSNRINEKTFDGCHNKIEQNNDTVMMNMNMNTTVPADMQHTMVLSGDMIGDITFNLVENSMHGDDLSDLNVMHGMEEEVVQPISAIGNETFKKPTAALHLDEYNTALPNINATTTTAAAPTVNTTFDCQDQEQDLTPENVDKKLAALLFNESTPQTTSVRYQTYKNNKQYTPSIKLSEDFNISPIVAATDINNATHLIMNKTFEPTRIAPAICLTNNTTTTTAEDFHSEKLSKTINLPKFSETFELLDNVENPNETYNTRDMMNNGRKLSQASQEERQAEDARKQMQNVMDLAEAEVELLAQQNDEEQFEHMLDEWGRVELNPEQLKMQKSLDSIKKRFNYSGHGVGPLLAARGERELSREAQDMRDLTQHMNDLMGGGGGGGGGGEESEETTVTLTNFNTTNEVNESLREMALRQSRKDISNDLKMSRDLSSSSASGLTTSTSVMSSQGSERLLSRRSRLYDDVNLSTLSNNSNGSNGNTLYPKSTSNSTSFVVQKDNTKAIVHADTPETETQKMQETEAATSVAAAENSSSYKLAEKRERDRDRFKTIKITKQRTDVVVAADGTELNVPCIDDDIDDENKIKCYNADHQLKEEKLRRQETKLIEPNTQQSQRISRRDCNTPSEVVPVFNNNKSEVEQTKSNTQSQRTTATNPNYLTYKKPKDKLTKYNLPDITAPTPALPSDQEKEVQQSNRLPQPRSLSRPRYISGLQKFNVVKATSASDLQKTTIRQSNAATMMHHGASRQQGDSGALKSTTELKSPMGMKSKSFHNLSSNFGAGSGSGLLAPRPSLGYGLKKLNANAATSERQSRQITSRYTTSTMSNGTTQAEKTDDSVFKVPKLVSSLRAPNITTSGLKRTTVVGGGGGGTGGLARPSSGYYSLNVIAKANSGSSIQQQSQAAIDSSDNETGGRHSPSESLSSASSRGSLYGGTKHQILAHNISNGPKTNVIDTNAILAGKLTQVTIGASGIPKPSGLRPPTNAKRSGLPRPSSIVRR